MELLNLVPSLLVFDIVGEAFRLILFETPWIWLDLMLAQDGVKVILRVLRQVLITLVVLQARLLGVVRGLDHFAGPTRPYEVLLFLCWRRHPEICEWRHVIQICLLLIELTRNLK